MKAGLGKETLQEKGWKFTHELPFDSERKLMSVAYPAEEDKRCKNNKKVPCSVYCVFQSTQTPKLLEFSAISSQNLSRGDTAVEFFSRQIPHKLLKRLSRKFQHHSIGRIWTNFKNFEEFFGI
jgi:magnesium-transporting ATPase (P-type)